MDPIIVVGGALVAGFAVGFFVAQHNAKQAASIVAAVNSAKDAITAHVTATAASAPQPPSAS